MMLDLILVFVYNGFFLSLLLIWVYLTTARGQQLVEGFRERVLVVPSRWFYLVCVLIIVGILAFQLFYGVHNTDVDDAISSATLAFLAGKNPYAELVTVHHPPDGGIMLGYYHYFPVDLIIHAMIYVIVGQPLAINFPTFWFVAGYLLLLPPTAWAYHRIIDLPLDRSLLTFLILVLPFLWSNSLLTLVGFIWGYYAWKVKDQRGWAIGIWIFSSASKYITGVLVFFLFVQDLLTIATHVHRQQHQSSRRQVHASLKLGVIKLTPYTVGAFLFLLTWLPFGVWEVFRGVFLYQGSLSERSGIAEIKGPLLVEVLKLIGFLDWYNVIFLMIIVVSIIGVLWFYNGRPFQQFIIMSLILMLVFPFYGTELFCAPAAAMFIYLLTHDDDMARDSNNGW